jgi:hypothetical protein
MRQPNELYKFGLSVLVHTKAGTSIRNIDSDDSIADVFGRSFDSAVIVNIGPVIKTVNKLISTTKDKK